MEKVTRVWALKTQRPEWIGVKGWEGAGGAGMEKVTRVWALKTQQPEWIGVDPLLILSLEGSGMERASLHP